MENEFKFNLGQKVKDEYSGLEGKVMSRAQYLTGCNRYGVQKAGLDEKGAPFEWNHFDEMQLVAVDDVKEPGKTTGGPRPALPRQQEAARRSDKK